MAATNGLVFGKALCEALGISPHVVGGIRIDAGPGAVKVEIDFLPSPEQLQTVLDSIAAATGLVELVQDGKTIARLAREENEGGDQWQ